MRRPRWSGSGVLRSDTPVGVLVYSFTLAALAVVLPLSWRWVTVPLVFFAPGNAVVSALFGRQLEFGGVRRLGLCGVMSLVSYSVMALIVFASGHAMTHTTVVASVATQAVVAAGIVWWRGRRWPEFMEPPHADYNNPLSFRLAAAPLVSLTMLFVVAYATVQLLPRKAADEYSAIAFDGTWALVNRVVEVEPDSEVQVDFRILNRSSSERTYVVTSGISLEQAGVLDLKWGDATVTVAPRSDYRGSVSGKIPEGACHARLEIGMNEPTQDDDRDPLTVYLRDRNAEC